MTYILTTTDYGSHYKICSETSGGVFSFYFSKLYLPLQSSYIIWIGYILPVITSLASAFFPIYLSIYLCICLYILTNLCICHHLAFFRSNLEKFEKLMVNVDAVTAENEKLHQRVKKLQQEVSTTLKVEIKYIQCNLFKNIISYNLISTIVAVS